MLDNLSLTESLWMLLLLGDHGADPEEAIARIRAAQLRCLQYLLGDDVVPDNEWETLHSQMESEAIDDVVIMASRNGAVDIFALEGDV